MRTAIALLLTLLPLSAGARDRCGAHGVAEYWADPLGRIGGVDVGVVECTSDFTAVKVGLTYVGYDGSLVEGVTASFRLQTGRNLVPYIGVGMLAAGPTSEYAGDEDGEDNDGDGTVDESSEARYANGDFTGLVYPEIGLTLLTREFGLTFTVRKYFGEEFDGDVVYGVGLTLGTP